MILVILGYIMHRMVQLKDLLLSHFRVMPAQARHKICAVSCHQSCQDCRHDPKFIVSCRTLSRVKMSYFVRPAALTVSTTFTAGASTNPLNPKLDFFSFSCEF
jgi:hypothetical protein